MRNRLTLSLVVVLLASAIAFSQTSEPSSWVKNDPNGQVIFEHRCATCHGNDAGGISSQITIAGPSLKAVHNPGDVMTAMEVGPSHMPSFARVLSIDEMRAVANYVPTLANISLEGGDLSQGGKLFREYCAPCHHTSVRGGALAFTGVNAPSLLQKSPEIIAGAIRWGPGPMPQFPPSVLSDKQIASIVKYVEFVKHPPSPGGSPMNWFGPVAEGFVAWVVMFFLVVLTGWIEKGGKG